MLRYTPEELLAVRRYDVTPPRAVRKTIFSYRLWLPVRLRERVRCQGLPWSRAGRPRPTPQHDQLTAGFLNICSITNKLDDLLDVRRDRSVDVLCLAETWHDTGCAAFNRLRAANYQVVDRPRPRSDALADQSTNHGGVAVITAPGINVTPVNAVADEPLTFEYVCARVTVGQFSAIVVVVYRPGSSAVQPAFFDELSSVFDVVATYQEAVYIVGDFNVHLECSDDPNTKQFVDLLTHYGFSVQPTSATHSAGGTIDAVISRGDMNTNTAGQCLLHVSVADVGLSDHHLLTWLLPACKLPLPPQTVRCRPWCRLNVDQLRDQIKGSTLCQSLKWPDCVDDMAAMYESELASILDRLIPFREFTRRPRPSDPWFDKDCVEAKRLTRRLERAHRAACRKVVNRPNVVSGIDPDVVATKDAWYTQRRNYRELCRRKRCAFWCHTVESDRESPRRLWTSVNQLLGRGRPPASSGISVDEFSQFFSDKVNAVRSNTAGAPDPVFSRVRPGTSLSSFTPVNVDDVISAITHLPDKSSPHDPLPVSVMKMVADEIAPFLAELFNRSMSSGHFPATFKEASITPAIKKPGLDALNVQSYRPISNLSVVSKLLERIVARQLNCYLQSSDLLPSLQSGFRPGHSTETAVLRVISDLLEAADNGNISALVLLDLSAAFDTVDHGILCRRLQVTFGLDGPVLAWFRSYLHGRTQSVRRGLLVSSLVQLLCGVPQGSVLGPILFIMYIMYINNYNKSLKKLQDFFFKTETKTKTFIFVLETPRDQDPVVSRTSVLKAMMWKVSLSLNLIYVMGSSTARVQLSTSLFCEYPWGIFRNLDSRQTGKQS